jgi:hypothetical protein
MNIGKKKTKKTKKQKGGLLQPLLSSPLATNFRFSPQKSFNTFIRERSNNILRRPNRENFINFIKNELIGSQEEYQKKVPVFYGNQSDINKSSGYNEYICKIVGVFSSRKRIFIINPFAEFVYCILLFCIENNYVKNIIKLQNLLKKLLKLDDFTGFPEITYLEYGIKFCIVKNNNGVETVITSKNSNISRCSYGYGCSLKMKAVIRKENIPSDQDILKLYNILLDEPVLLEEFYRIKNQQT